MKITNKTHIAGRGDILVCTLEDGDLFPKINDVIFYSNNRWIVTGIEIQQYLTDPLSLSQNIGLLVRKNEQ